MEPSVAGKKKVLHVITRMDMGGSAQNTLFSCLELDKEKFDVVSIYGATEESLMTALERGAVDGLLKRAEESGVRCFVLDDLVRRIDPVRDARAFFSLWRAIRRERPDIVHTHTSKAGLLGRWAGWLAGAPTIVHTPHGHVFYGHFNKWLSRLFFWLEKASEPITDVLIALTEGEKTDYLDLKLCGEQKLEKVHSGVDLDRFRNVSIDEREKKASLGLPQDAPVVCSVGWLTPIKGPQVLLEAMERLWRKGIDAHLLFVGKGCLEDRLRDRASDTGVSDKVHLAGWRNDVPEILKIADVLVMPSFNEGMGRAIVEAMASGLPVVGSDVGGIPDLIVNGSNGFLVPPGDVPALSSAIQHLLIDEGLRRKMGDKSRELAEKFGIDAMIARLETVYLRNGQATDR